MSERFSDYSASVDEFVFLLEQRMHDERPPNVAVELELAATDAAELCPGTQDRGAPAEGEVLEELDRLFAVIEYTGSDGTFSRRRVLMNRLVRAASGVCLDATCLERQAARRFRVDRIGAFLDADGVISPPDAFWRSIGVDTAAMVHNPAADGARKLRDRLRAPLSVLAALSASDGVMRDSEVAAILDWAEDEAHDRGLNVPLESFDLLGNHVRRMRPSAGALRNYWRTVTEMSRLDRFRSAMRRVVLADGEITREEARLAEILELWEREG